MTNEVMNSPAFVTAKAITDEPTASLSTVETISFNPKVGEPSESAPATRAADDEDRLNTVSVSVPPSSDHGEPRKLERLPLSRLSVLEGGGLGTANELAETTQPGRSKRSAVQPTEADRGEDRTSTRWIAPQTRKDPLLQKTTPHNFATFSA